MLATWVKKLHRVQVVACDMVPKKALWRVTYIVLC